MGNIVSTLLERYKENRIFKSHPTIQKIKEGKLTYLKTSALKDLSDAVDTIEREHIDGDIIEAGCALGGSSILICKHKKPERKLLSYDVFGMIPPPSDNDENDVHKRYEVIKSGESDGIAGDKYYGYEENLYDKVKNNFKAYGIDLDTYNVSLVKGLFEDTLKPDAPIALAHIDCDWYDSVMVCLESIYPQLVKNGVIVIDDYYAYSGCRKAVDDFFAKTPSTEYKFIKKTRLFVKKVG